ANAVAAYEDATAVAKRSWPAITVSHSNGRPSLRAASHVSCPVSDRAARAHVAHQRNARMNSRHRLRPRDIANACGRLPAVQKNPGSYRIGCVFRPAQSGRAVRRVHHQVFRRDWKLSQCIAEAPPLRGRGAAVGRVRAVEVRVYAAPAQLFRTERANPIRPHSRFTPVEAGAPHSRIDFEVKVERLLLSQRGPVLE